MQVQGQAQNEVRFMPMKPGAHIHQIPATHIIYTASQASKPAKTSQPAGWPATSHPASQPAASQPASSPAKPASQKEVRLSNTIWEWSTRSGLQKPYGSGQVGRNTPPIAWCTNTFRCSDSAGVQTLQNIYAAFTRWKLGMVPDGATPPKRELLNFM